MKSNQYKLSNFEEKLNDEFFKNNFLKGEINFLFFGDHCFTSKQVSKHFAEKMCKNPRFYGDFYECEEKYYCLIRHIDETRIKTIKKLLASYKAFYASDNYNSKEVKQLPKTCDFTILFLYRMDNIIQKFKEKKYDLLVLDIHPVDLCSFSFCDFQKFLKEFDVPVLILAPFSNRWKCREKILKTVPPPEVKQPTVKDLCIDSFSDDASKLFKNSKNIFVVHKNKVAKLLQKNIKFDKIKKEKMNMKNDLVKNNFELVEKKLGSCILKKYI